MGRIGKDWEGLRKIGKDWERLRRIEKDRERLRKIGKDWEGDEGDSASVRGNLGKGRCKAAIRRPQDLPLQPFNGQWSMVGGQTRIFCEIFWRGSDDDDFKHLKPNAKRSISGCK